VCRAAVAPKRLRGGLTHKTHIAYITGTFTADSTTQSFQSIGGVGSTAYANAMQIRIVPEPTQMVSVAAIGAALGMWRTRKLQRNGRDSDATAC
jgi:hypothetical protein